MGTMWFKQAPIDGHPDVVGGLLFSDQQVLRRQFQWIAFGVGTIADADLEWFGFHVVERTAPPADIPDGHVAFNDLPELVDGVWRERFKVVPHESWMPPLPEAEEPEPEVSPAEPEPTETE